jgi:hypothetical protein
LALAALWPAVDEYSAESNARTELAASLEEARAAVGRLPKLEEAAKVQKNELARLESLTLGEDKLPLFRGRVVELARACGCQVRQIRVGQSRKQPWKPGESWLAAPNRATGQPSGGLVLSLCELTVTVSGPLPGTQQFLEKLAALGALMYPRQFALAPAEGQDKEVILDLGVWLFDLDRQSPESS